MKPLFPLLMVLATSLAQAQEVPMFTGDKKLACEAVMCLASSQRPSECMPSLERYFSINGKHAAEDRRKFLELCPSANSSSEMHHLTNALVSGSGQCDIASLNSQRTLTANAYGEWISVISNQMPAACVAFYADPIIAAGMGNEGHPAYVGTPEQGGYWVSAKDYPAAQADYNRQLDAWKNGG